MAGGPLAPVLYIPHGGGPLPLLGDPGHAELVRFLSSAAESLPRPDAVLVVSAHWEEPAVAVTSGSHPELLYDYYGFPEESYSITYPAPGSPALAARIAALLEGAGIDCLQDPGRPFDHGMFVPLKLMYPAADVPCVQLSLVADLDPARHVAIGRALAPLRDEKVLVLGSGMSFHNLRVIWQPNRGAAEGNEFTDWLDAACCDESLSAAERERRLVDWPRAPHARFVHPREEHLLPLHVCAGAASLAPARLVYSGAVIGRRVSAYLW